jgi:hypothetical protein
LEEAYTDRQVLKKENSWRNIPLIHQRHPSPGMRKSKKESQTQFLVGFALETETTLAAHAREKIK